MRDILTLGKMLTRRTNTLYRNYWRYFEPRMLYKKEILGTVEPARTMLMQLKQWRYIKPPII